MSVSGRLVVTWSFDITLHFGRFYVAWFCTVVHDVYFYFGCVLALPMTRDAQASLGYSDRLLCGDYCRAVCRPCRIVGQSMAARCLLSSAVCSSDDNDWPVHSSLLPFHNLTWFDR